MAGERHGSKAELHIGDSVDDTLQKIEGVLSTASLDEQIDTAETTAFEDEDKRYIPGLADATASAEGSYSGPTMAHIRSIKRLVRSFEYFPAGNVSGEEKLSGELLVTSISRSSSTDDKVSASFEFQITGGVVGETIA